MGIEIKIRLLKLGKTQRWLLEELRKRGYSTLDATRLSSINSGAYTGGYAPEVLKASDQILKEEENRHAE